MKCFVIMPYGNHEKDPARKRGLDSLYEHFIRPAVEAVNVPGRNGGQVICHRGDKEPGPGEIITHIVENLVLSEIAIADLTGRNSNVFYELGVRHAVSDNTILISESEDDVPFDLRGQRLILYTRDFEGGARLRNEITRAVQDIVRAPGKIDNPVRRFLFDRERQKLLQQIEAQGRPPGYDFVNELLQEMSNLRKDFKAQLDEVRFVMKAATAPQPASTTVSAVQLPEDLSFLEGAWHAEPNNSYLYARIVGGQLLVPYSYSGNGSLDSHFFNFRRIGDNIFARFQWFDNHRLSGYLLVKIESPDHLVGGWWYSEAVPGDVADDLTRMNRSLPGMHHYQLRRIPDKRTPKWAADYFEKHSQRAATKSG